MGEDDRETLDGTLEQVVFQNATTHWTVARLAPETGPLVTVVGALLGVSVGAPLRLSGSWVDDPRFGRQFRVDSYHTRSPETLIGIERYLGSGLIPGIGPELAKRIVARFGLATFEVLAGKPERLQEVAGIGKSRANKIVEAWSEQKDVQDVMVFLRGHGVSAAFAVRIYKCYGRDAIGLIRENPYRLALDIRGIAFKSADAIARTLGIERDAPERLEAGLVHALGELAEEGHLHVPQEHLLDATGELLGVGRDLLDGPLERLIASNLVILELLGDRGLCISLVALWEHESEGAALLAALVDTPMRGSRLDARAAVQWFEEASGLRLSPQQRQAVQAAAVDKCTIVTGGPGVGKTTIVRAIVRIFSAKDRTVALAAPTGRAAKRLSESTGYEATTIHRLLEFQPQSGAFMRGVDNLLEADVVIIDEVSMVDMALFHYLLLATHPQSQLILVGDIDQLPSVGPGAVLAEVIDSNAANVVRLTEIFRQAEASRIVVNAHRINRGLMPEVDILAPGAPLSDFYFIGRKDVSSVRDTIVELVAERIPHRFGFDPVRGIQVLTPMHRGEIGTIALNRALQQRLNPGDDEGAGDELRRGDRVFRRGDKVMQIRNDYERSVFNGDIGVIHSIGTAAPHVAVEMLDGRMVAYELAELDQLTHAFAVSVHKSQGSEYPAVVMPLVTQHYMMLQRNLLYTGITRGKQLVVLVGSKKAVSMAVNNVTTSMRWTWLAERIRVHLSRDA